MELFRRFGSDQKGTTALIFGLAVLPLIGIGGAAVDYTRASMTQSRMQMAADLAALAIVKLPTTASQAEINKIAKDTVESTFGTTLGVRTTGGYTVEQPVVTRSGKEVKVKIAGSADSAFMRFAGMSNLELGANSTAQWSAKKIEIALVLDNTGSMDQRPGGKRKMDELIAGASRFINDANEKAVNADSIKISIVPFDTQVRVGGLSAITQNLLRFPDLSLSLLNWKGYIVDRAGRFAASDAAPVDEVSKYPAERSDWPKYGDLPIIQPLTSVQTGRTEMLSKIKAMQPRGNTNIGLGVTWGTATLSAGVPFTEASTDPNVQRFMIVFTDGKNTSYRKDGAVKTAADLQNPSSTDPVVIAMNAYTLAACTEAKKVAAVYTIRLLDGDEGMLKACASSPGNYQNVTDPSDLTATFKKILEDILGTRVTS